MTNGYIMTQDNNLNVDFSIRSMIPFLLFDDAGADDVGCLNEVVGCNRIPPSI